MSIGFFLFIHVFNFFQQCFIVFIVFIPGYFILFGAIVSGIVFVISFSGCWLCIEMQLIFMCWLYVLLLCWIHLLSPAVFVFLVELLVFCREGASLVAQMVKNSPAVWETWVQSLGQEDPLDKGMAFHSVFLPGESHGQRSLGGYSLWGCKKSDMTKWLTLSVDKINLWCDRG